MGRLEKIVVLTVLFLVAVILGVSLNQGTETPQPAPEGTLAQAPPQHPASQPEGPAGALNTMVGEPVEEHPRTEASEPVEPPPEALQPPVETTLPREPAHQPAQSGPEPTPPAEDSTPPPSATAEEEDGPGLRLLTTEGLTESKVPDLMLYTWAEGDDYKALAARFFGTELEVGLLRKANEGVDDAGLRPGDTIFVPVRAGEPTERLARSEETAGQWSGGVYHVESGDMLGKIAQKVYGSASKWRVIYEANRDVLASPDSLQVGMALRIPRVD